MGSTIDIDTDGTFTDGFFTNGQEVRYAKVPTTPHDLTVGGLVACCTIPRSTPPANVHHAVRMLRG